jgi:hypothetical protein
MVCSFTASNVLPRRALIIEKWTFNSPPDTNLNMFTRWAELVEGKEFTPLYVYILFGVRQTDLA